MLLLGMMFIIVYNQQINYEKDLVMYIVYYFVFFIVTTNCEISNFLH